MSKIEKFGENVMAALVLAAMVVYYSIPVVGVLTFVAFAFGVL